MEGIQFLTFCGFILLIFFLMSVSDMVKMYRDYRKAKHSRKEAFKLTLQDFKNIFYS